MKRNILVFLFVSFVLFLGFVFMAGCGTGGGGGTPLPTANIIWVDSLNGNDATGEGTELKPFKTIAKGMSSAEAGDTVRLKAGTYSEAVIWPNKNNLTLKGESRDNTTIEGSSRVITIKSLPSGSTATIQDLTITGGTTTEDGGGIYVLATTLNALNVIFSENFSGDDGGGVYMAALSNFVATNCIFKENSAEATSGSGGGVYVVNGGTFTATNCIFKNNSAEYGGGIIVAYGTLDATGCTFESNTAEFGGGVYQDSPNPISLKKCAIYGNKVTGESSANGAGIFVASGGGRIENCIIYCNRAKTNGGGIFHHGVALEIVNCTIVSNEAGDFSGGIRTDNSANTTEIMNCIVWGNSAPSYSQISGTPSSIDYCDIQGGGFSGTGNVDVAPNFESVEESSFDLHLTSNSPASVTQGGTKTGAPSEDFDGKPRSNPDYVSMGAYEY